MPTSLLLVSVGIFPNIKKGEHEKIRVKTMSKLLTIDEVAQILNVTDRTVRNLCKRSELTHFRVGGQIRIDKNDLQEYLNKIKKGDLNNDKEQSINE